MSSLKERFFPLGDHIPAEVRQKLRAGDHYRATGEGFGNIVGRLKEGLDVRAVYSGEVRAPKKGEWYLSGAQITAYKAPNDLGTEYHIAELVLVRSKRRVTETTVTKL